MQPLEMVVQAVQYRSANLKLCGMRAKYGQDLLQLIKGLLGRFSIAGIMRRDFQDVEMRQQRMEAAGC